MQCTEHYWFVFPNFTCDPRQRDPNNDQRLDFAKLGCYTWALTWAVKRRTMNRNGWDRGMAMVACQNYRWWRLCRSHRCADPRTGSYDECQSRGGCLRG